MKQLDRISIAILALLGALCVVQFSGLADGLVHRHPELRMEPGRRRQGTLSQADRARLASFDEGIRITYYGSPRAGLPPHLTHLEKNVRAVLAAFEQAAADSGVAFEAQVVFPDEHPDWADPLASAGLAPWRARRVEGDGYREDEIWSSLRIAYGPRPAAVQNGIGPAQVFELQNLILEQLEELRTARRPRVAICAPQAGYDDFRTLLHTGADVVEVDFNHAAQLPEAVDLFFWFEPTLADNRHLAALDAMRARGASVVLAGHRIESTEGLREGNITVHFKRGSPAMDTLLQHHGLIPVQDLLLDPSAGERIMAPADGGPAVQQFVPWFVRSTANNQDFRTLQGQPNGSLLFRTPSAFYADPARLGELGLNVAVLASASNGASLHEMPTQELDSVQVSKLRGRPQPNVALAALLRPADPWGGRVLALGDSAVFGDAHWTHEHYAHQAFSQVLLTTLLSGERMVAGRVALRAPAPLPQLSNAKRTFLRSAVVLSLPALLALIFVLRQRPMANRSRGQRPWIWVVASALLGVPAIQVLVSLTAGLDADLTGDGRNRMNAEVQGIFEPFFEQPTDIELIFSAPAQLPPQFKPLVRELRRTCERLADNFNTLSLSNRWIAAADPSQMNRLKEQGVRPVAVSSTQAEFSRMFRVYSAVRVTRGNSSVLLQFPTERSFRYLSFRLAHALERLDRGKSTKLALFAEPPRLSPAEATLEYQRKGLFAPREGDVYSECEDLLREFDFDISRLEAGRDSVPDDLDALLWMQPRRDLLPMVEALAGHLAEGGSALVAGQHFRILSRQLEGTGLQQRFWPEPQFFDLNREYLPRLGIELPRLVSFDSSFGSIQMKTRVDSTEGGARYTTLPTTQPFLVQPGSEDQGTLRGQWLFPFATQVRWDSEQLAKSSLRVTPWIQGGSKPWTYAWSGGDLPPEALAPDAGMDGKFASLIERADSPACYGALFSGSFPPAQLVEQPERRLIVLDGQGSNREGKLLLLGNSEAFTNGFLTMEEYDHENLLLRGAAALALPEHLTPLLDERRGEPALEPQDPGTRSRWRWIVMGGPTALLLIAGLLRRRVA